MTESVFPHVEVEIQDNSFETTATEVATFRMFTPVISEKGKDNEVVYVSPNTYVSKFGELNYKLQGQAGYNVVNALANGGGAYVIRTMPENATFAHAIINVQVKTSKKKVKDLNGNLVDKDNLDLRPVTMYARNATSLENVVTSLSYDYKPTLDGYDNYPILAVVPEGRGAYYNRYSFRITPTNDYDSTFDFRTYLFETLETTSKGTTSVIEGPFLVSLEPGTVNLSNQSVFIKNVLDNYSDIFKVKFNESKYNELTSLINSEVPKSVDPLFGTTREVNDQPETYFDVTTGKDEDIHLSLHQYDNDGELFTYSTGVPVLNFVDVESPIQATILKVDDTIRQLNYTEVESGIERMKLALSRFKKDSYGLLVDTIATYDENQELLSGSLFEAKKVLDTQQALFETAKTDYDAAPTEENLLTLVKRIDIFFDSVKVLKKEVLTLIYTAKAVASTTNLLDAVVQLTMVEKELSLYDIMKIEVADKQDKLILLKTRLENIKAIPTSVVKLETVHNTLFESDEIIRYIVASDIVTEIQADASIAEAKVKYVTATDAYADAIDSYILPSELDELVLKSINTTADLLDHLLKTVDLIMIENSINDCQNIAEIADRFIIEAVQALKDSTVIAEEAAKSADTKQDMVDTIKVNINTESSALVPLEFERYVQNLRSYSSVNPLINGSEGDLDPNETTAEERQKTINNLFIKAFKGLIDDSILDEDLVEFEILCDANFDTDVKFAMIQLATDTRADIAVVADLGLTPTPEHALQVRKNTMTVDNSRVFIYGQDETIYDENSSTDIQVTTPYFVAGMIPYNESAYGLHQPLAGKRALVTGVKKYSWLPNKDYKQLLYKNQVNYIESTKTRIGLGTQLTSQRRNSAMSNINNVLTVLQLRRKVLSVASEHIMELVNENNLERLNTDFADLVNVEFDSGAYDDLSVTAYANDYDIAKKIYRIRIELVFKDIIERIYASIVVNK